MSKSNARERNHLFINKKFIFPLILILSFSSAAFAAPSCPQLIYCKENKKLASCSIVGGSDYFYVWGVSEDYLMVGNYQFNYVEVKNGLLPKCVYTHSREPISAIGATSDRLLQPDTVARNNKWRKSRGGFACGYPLNPMSAADCPFKMA